MVLVFKTSLQTEQDCQQLVSSLGYQADIVRWTVDLEDCDKVLRVVTTGLSADCIVSLVESQGFLCAELAD